MARSTVSPDVRAAALADLHAGEQPAVVAERYGLDREVVKKWKIRYVPTRVPDHVPDHVPVPSLQRPTLDAQKEQIGAIIIDLLRAKLKASQAIAAAVANPDWLAVQPAAELAALGSWLDNSAFAIGDRLAQCDSDTANDTAS